jgi:protein SCO1
MRRMSKPASNDSSSLPLLIAAAVLALAVGAWLASSLLPRMGAPEPDDLVTATYLAGGKPVVQFSLIDHHGQTFDNSRLHGQWTFVFFGFTHCPDICPMTLAVLDEVERRIDAEGLGPVQSVFVSVDPQRDTPERLAEYVPYFNPGFIGVTGAEEEPKKFTRDLGILYVRHEPEENGSYMVDHSSSLLLFSPDGELAALFRAPHQPDPVHADFVRIRQFQ